MQGSLFSAERVRTILMVATQKSFSRAAVELGISQPAVSQQVRKVEDDLGRRLFDRSTHGLSLTTDGEAFLAYASAMQRLGDDARRHFAQPRVAGAIRLGLIEDVARSALAGVLAAFFRDFPLFELETVCDQSHRLLADFDDGRYDLVIARTPPDSGRGILLVENPLVWIGRDAQPIADPLPLVLPPAPDLLRAVALDALRAAGRRWQLRLQTSSLAVIEAAVSTGIGVTLRGQALPHPGCIELDAASGLPPLPRQRLALERHRTTESDEGVAAMAAMVQETAAALLRRQAMDEGTVD